MLRLPLLRSISVLAPLCSAVILACASLCIPTSARLGAAASPSVTASMLPSRVVRCSASLWSAWLLSSSKSSLLYTKSLSCLKTSIKRRKQSLKKPALSLKSSLDMALVAPQSLFSEELAVEFTRRLLMLVLTSLERSAKASRRTHLIILALSRTM